MCVCCFANGSIVSVHGFGMPHRLGQVDKVWCAAVGVPQSYQVNDILPSMVGESNDVTLKTKGAETGTLVRWASVWCDSDLASERLPHAAEFASAGQCLVEYMDILRSHGFNVPWDACLRLMFLAVRHLNLMSEAQQLFQPKSHMLVHLTRRIPQMGNPRCYSCFADESLNLVVAGLASVAHRACWEISIFARVRLLPLVQTNSAWASL